MDNCSNCKYVRKAGNSNYVACGYISAIKHGLEPVPLISKQNFYGDLVTKEVDFDEWFNTQVKFKDEHEVYNGWAYLAVKPESEIKGLMSSECVIISKENCCNFYKQG